jgi:hypothetical protein
MLQPPGSRTRVSLREVILLAALVIAGISWYREYDRSREISQELAAVKQKFGGMLDAENALRRHPEQEGARLVITELGSKPKLQWTMDLKVYDTPAPTKPALSGEAAKGQTPSAAPTTEGASAADTPPPAAK